jgi:hypothetical protein
MGSTTKYPGFTGTGNPDAYSEPFVQAVNTGVFTGNQAGIIEQVRLLTSDNFTVADYVSAFNIFKNGGTGYSAYSGANAFRGQAFYLIPILRYYHGQHI